MNGRKMRPNDALKKEDEKLGFKFSLPFSLALRLRQFTLVSLGLDFFINKMCGGGGVGVVT